MRKSTVQKLRCTNHFLVCVMDVTVVGLMGLLGDLILSVRSPARAWHTVGAR